MPYELGLGNLGLNGGASDAPAYKPGSYSVGFGDLTRYDENGVEIDTPDSWPRQNTRRHGSSSWLIPVLLCLGAAT